MVCAGEALSHLIMASESYGLLKGFYLAVISRRKYTNSWEDTTDQHCTIGIPRNTRSGEERRYFKMNLFCFTLEGSMDSLYEPVQQSQETNENSSSRASSPLNTNTKNVLYERSLSLEFSDVENTELRKKSNKSHIQKSVSENEAFETEPLEKKSWSTIQSQHPRKAENPSHLRRHCYIEDLSEDDFLMGEKTNLLTRQNTKENQSQEVDDTRSEAMGTLKRLQKLVRSKKQSVAEDGKNTFLPQSLTLGANEDDDDDEEQTLTTCMKLTKSQDKKTCKDPVRKKSAVDYYSTVGSLDRSSNAKWSTPGDLALDSDHSFLSDWKTFTGNDCDPLVFSIKPIQEWEKCTCCNHHTQLPPSLTDMDLPYSWRTSSFGAFDRFRKSSASKPEHLNETHEAEILCEGGATECDKTPNNAGSLTKKMKAISLTMRKKMGKKYIQALSEDTDDTEEYNSHRDSDPEGRFPTEKAFLKASESVESLYSLNSGQSSSSGVTSSSDGTNRDSLRLDEDISYTGPFCGRAKVHTDFTPSPYDAESLKIKKGDIIDIICKTPMGIWTGMLHNKVGNFKFIYVDIISEEEMPPRRIKARRKSKRPKPKTLQELMERLNLQDYISSLLLNGYETLEDLKDLKESHLHELNITSSEERARLLAAIENLQDCENDQELENKSVPPRLRPGNPANKCDLSDCPRDSGCYISLESSENSKDETEAETLCENVQKITITESA
ncbi:uncharacterized protein LOC108707432 isoform X3 [Xenopus laevis]|uniref:Uncharacterized protein LOC108707432 isoform X3 n=1 Tax=Xenopus laevis TaxID=8355 RepID=A0A8J1M922_XENLA|nr:uncharacterized protein LOC108707432 isoform X3 [Xenopus laevis]